MPDNKSDKADEYKEKQREKQREKQQEALRIKNDNQRENRQAADAARAAGLDRQQSDKLQRDLEQVKDSGGAKSTYREAVEKAKEIKQDSGH